MEMSAILEANHGPGVYDRLFAHSDAEKNNENDFEMIQSRIRYVLKTFVNILNYLFFLCFRDSWIYLMQKSTSFFETQKYFATDA